MEQRDDDNRKKAYQRPVVKRYPLRPDEAVLGFCKSGAVINSGAANCGAPVPCRTRGS